MKKKKEVKGVDIENIQRILRTIPRCRICGNALISTCDRAKKSVLTEFMGSEHIKTKPQFMYMYPKASHQSQLCFYHQNMEENKKENNYIKEVI